MTQPSPPPVPVSAEPGSRLEQLLASYEGAKAAAQEAKDRFEAITEALKAEIAAAAPQGSTEIMAGGAPSLPRLKLSWKRPYRFDVKRFRAERPLLYVRYEVRSDGHWELRAET